MDSGWNVKKRTGIIILDCHRQAPTLIGTLEIRIKGVDMHKVSKKPSDVKPIRFELVDDDLGSTFERPEYLCQCGMHYSFVKDDLCSWCVDNLAKKEGSKP